jgi:hypothetical protein
MTTETQDAPKARKYDTVGIRPKYEFNETSKRQLTGTYVDTETVPVGPNNKKPFDVHVICDETGMEYTVSGGHLDYLFEKALDDKKLTKGQGVRITFLGWSAMDDGNKARNYNLEIERV